VLGHVLVSVLRIGCCQRLLQLGPHEVAAAPAQLILMMYLLRVLPGTQFLPPVSRATVLLALAWVPLPLLLLPVRRP